MLTDKELVSTREFVKNHEIHTVAEKLLFVLGFKCNLLGTTYLKDAIVMQYNNAPCSLCKEIYPGVAAVHNATSERVERAIRHAINVCYESQKPTELSGLFGKSPITNKYSPSSGEFISILCTWIRLERAEETSDKDKEEKE